MILLLYRIAGLSVSVLEELSDLLEDQITASAYQNIYKASAQKAVVRAHHPSVELGILMTSHSLAQRLAAMRAKSPDVFRKKEQQTARSSWQLLSRIAGKTSPFSRFTHLAVPELAEATPNTITSLIRINNQLLGQLLALLRYHPPFYQTQKISLNDTLYLDKGEYVFLLNTRNLESVQRMEPHPVMNRIIKWLQQQKKWPFFKLVDELMKEIEAERKAVEAYVFKLTEYGLLRWQLPVAANALDWWTPLSAELRSVKADELCMELADCLGILSKKIRVLNEGTVEERKHSQQAAYKTIDSFWKKYNAIIPIMDSEKMMTDGLTRLADKALLVKPENLFFEDTKLAIGKALDRVGWKMLDRKMYYLLKVLPIQNRDKIQATLLRFYQQNFNQPTNLWTFYQVALRTKLPEQLIETGKKVAPDFYNNKIFKKASKCPGELSLTTNDWKEEEQNRSMSAYACLVMPFQENGIDHWYVDTMLEPNGRLVGRFLPLFPAEIQTQWRDFHTQQAGDMLWVENRDASYFNANVSAPLLSVRIEVPSQEAPEAGTTISITDLMIAPSETGEALKFTYQNKPVKILNLSSEAVSNRSGLFQFLTHFTPGISTKQPLLHFINQQYSPTKDGVIFYPKVDFEKQLILQRRTWYFPIDTLPYKTTNAAALEYWQLLLRWKAAHQLPDHLYYTLHAQEVGATTTSSRTHHKPQFFDFYNSLAIDVFHREIKKVTRYLKVEEMLPGIENLITVNGAQRMVEVLVAGVLKENKDNYQPSN